MKTKKLFNKIVIAILGMMLLIGAGTVINKVVKNNPNTKAIGSAIGEYTAVQNGDEAITNTNFVTFDAYFLKNGQKVRGAYLPFTKKEPYGYNVATTDLWMEIKVLSNGSLRNGKLLFTRDNVEETFALIEDDFVKSDIIGDNALSVSLKDIQTGTTKLLKIKITPNVNKFFSNDNKVKLVGDHVDNDGRITRIEKEVNFAIDTSVDNAVAMNKIYTNQFIVREYYDNKLFYISRNYYNDDRIFKDNGDIFFSYYNQINFGSYQNSEEDVSNLSLKEGVIEGEVTAIDGVYPSEILLNNVYGTINSNDFIIEYNQNNGKFKIRFINPRYFGHMCKIGIDTVYKKDSINLSVDHICSLKTTAYAVVNNNDKLNNPLISNKVEVLESIKYRFVPKDNGNLFIYPPHKDIPIAKYEGDEFERDLENWYILWDPFVDNLNGNKEVVLYQDVNNYDKLTPNFNNLQNAVDIDNYVTNTGVSIDYRGIVADNARIDLYDNDTGSLIHTFNKSEIEYAWNKTYKLDPNIKHLKYVIKNIDLYNEKTRLAIKNFKTINNKELIKNVNRSEFDKLNYISSGYTIKVDTDKFSLRNQESYYETNRVKVSHFSLENNNNYNMNFPVSKMGMIKAYNGIDTGDDLYKTIWTIKSENRHEENLQIISKDGEKFINASYNVKGSYSRYHGIQFLESPRVLLGDNGWIKVYNNETGELVTVFNNSNWDNYISNSYIYGNDIKSIKILTSKIVNRAYFHISHIMKIDDDLLKENVSREEFDKIVQLTKELEYSSKLAVNSSEFTGKGKEETSVGFWDVRSIVEVKEPILLNSYKTKNVFLKFKLDSVSFDSKYGYGYGLSYEGNWKKSTVLMEFPKDIINIEIGNIGVVNANVLGYEIIDKDGKKFLKIDLDSDHFVREQDINVDANITVNPLVDSQDTVIKVYALNAANDLYAYKENNKFVDLNDKKDVYDIDGDNDKDEKVGYTEIKTKIIAPDDLYVNQKIIDYNTAGDVVNAPNIGVIDGNGTGKAKVVIQLKNNYSPSITDVRLAGAIPFEGNKGLLTGNDFNSKNTTIMMGPIKVPDDLKNDVKVYYSENLEISNTNKSWVDPANNWKLAEDVTDWSKIKHYYIDFGDKVININEIKEFSYEVQMPQNVAYNNPTYASIAFTANLNTNDGKLFTSGEANKVGLQLLKRFDLEIESNKLNSEYKIGGTSYLIKLDDDSDNRSVITNTNGKAKISGLLLDKEYTIEKKSIDENYLGDSSKVRFKVIESNGNRILQFIDGENNLSSSEIIQPTSDTLTKVNFKFSYISKYNLTLNKVDSEDNQPLIGITYSLYEGEQVIKTSGTGKNGTIVFKGLTPGLEYTIKEVRADGYYLNEPFKFKVVNTDGNPAIVKLSGNGENLVVNKSNKGLDEASVKFTNLRAKKYSIDITKYVKGKEQKLAGAGFMVTGNDFVTGKVAETDENGHLVINGLYEYKPGQSYSGEYTIEEIAAPSGYTRNAGKLKIKAQRNASGILEISVIEDTLVRNISTGKDIVLEGADTETPVYKIGVENSPLFTIIKTDAKTGERLPKTKFAIYEVNDDASEGIAYDSKGNIVGNEEEINGVRYRVIETDENGEYTKDLKPGKYKFIELSTVDKKYDISKQPILVNIGKQNKPKYGWTEGTTIQSGVEEYFKKYPNTNFAIIALSRGVGVNTEKVEYRKIENGFGSSKVYWSTYDRYKAMGVYSRYSWDDKVVLIRDLTEGNKRFVVLDINTGAEIRSIPMENDSEEIVSAKIIYNGVTKKYKVYDDEYNLLFEFQREGDILYGLSSLKKIGNNYYIQIWRGGRNGRDRDGRAINGRDIAESKLLKFDNDRNLIKEYDNSVLTDDNNIMKVEWTESQIDWMNNFKFIVKFYDLEENLIMESEPVNVEMDKPYFEVFKNGDILSLGSKSYYKFGITVPGEEPVSEINVKNNWKKFNIKAKYSPNGSITDITASDVDWKTLEELEINSNSNKEIKITPDAGFKITKVLVNEEEINLNINPDGSMDLPKFENIKEDKLIRAEFGNNIGYVKVNHYKKDTNEKLAESETLVGNYSDNYTASPAIIKGYELERDVAGDFVKPTNATGTFTTDDIEVNYYYQPKQVDVITSYELENGTKIIPDSTQKVEYGKDYTTVPGTVDNKYELISTPDNSNGKISSETPVTVRYIYKLKDAKVTVHHYIDGTTDKVPNNEGGVNEDQVINGRVDDAYNTAAITTIPANYKVVNTPANAAGTMTVDPIEVTYFYKLKDATIENSNFEKTSPQIVDNVNQKFVYNIKYSGNVRDYIGKGVLEIVDTLPYKIDIDKSDLAGGEYDEEHKTIKWKILVNNINSFDNNGNVEIIKTFGVVYKDLPIEEHANIRNVANVKFSLKDVPEVVGVTNKEKEVETTTDGQFARRITVNKTWSDDNNVNGKRPTSIKYVLKGGNTPIEQVVTGNVTTNEDWSYTFTNVPKYNDRNELINYTLEEEAVVEDGLKFYKKSISGDMNDGFDVTNTFKIPTETISVKADKHWADNSNQAKKRPTSIILRLKNGAEIVEDKTLTGTGDDWTYTFENVPKYNQFGNEVNYSLEELETNTGDLKFYNKNIAGTYKSGFTVTNTFNVPDEKVNVAVTKNWDDNSNANAKRPASIKYVLSGNGLTKEQVVTGNTTTDENWSYTFANLPKYNELGNIINYSVEEQAVNVNDFKFYTNKIIGDKDSGFRITNKFVVPEDKIQIQVTKHWEDNNNVNNRRPESIKFVIKQNNSEIKSKVVTGSRTTDENWSYIFDNLAKFDENGQEIDYVLEEQEVNADDMKFYTGTTSGNRKSGFVVTNKFTVPNETIKPRVTIEWEDNSNNKNKRPNDVKVVVKNNNGKIVKEGNVTGNPTDNSWTKEFEDVPKYDGNGKEIPYTVEVIPNNPNDLEFYVPSIKGDKDKGFVVTERFTVPGQTIDLNVVKKWNDNSNARNKRPESIKLVVKNGNDIVNEKVITGTGNEWTYTFNKLPKYNNDGEVINYTVDEQEVNEGDLLFYSKEVNNNVITNTMRLTGDGEVTDSKVEKTSTLEKITDANQEIPYSIKYSGKIDKYIGTAKVTIIDKLPFEIDEAKSDIGDGIYDSVNKTITFIENINGIDTYKDGIKEVNVVRNIKVVYKNLRITPDAKDVNNQVSVNIDLKDTNKKIDENGGKKIPTDLTSKVIVKYIVPGDNGKVSEDKIIEGKVGKEYHTTPPDNVDNDYELIKVDGDPDGIITQEPKTISYIYKKKNGKVIVRYVDKDSNKKLYDDEVIEGKIGDKANIKPKEVPYYNLVEEPKDVEITSKEQIVTYSYKKKIFNMEVYKTVKDGSIDGEQKTFANGKFTKLDIPVKKVNNSKVKIRYSVKVKNTGEIKGSAIVAEYLPEYFEMLPEENPDWTFENGKILSKEVELNPSEEKELIVTLTWKNGRENFGNIVNKVEIDKTKNDAGFDETDSEEEKKGKDNKATVVLMVKTGLDINNVLRMIGVGITLTALVGAMGYTISRKVKE